MGGGGGRKPPRPGQILTKGKKKTLRDKMPTIEPSGTLRSALALLVTLVYELMLTWDLHRVV